MSKSDPPQVQTDALTSEDSENIADLAAEESINDPVSSIVLLSIAITNIPLRQRFSNNWGSRLF
jgi:hypothetical protein